MDTSFSHLEKVIFIIAMVSNFRYYLSFDLNSYLDTFRKLIELPSKMKIKVANKYYLFPH